eukprot:807827-Pelagomonas_calceolata.AAC.4
MPGGGGKEAATYHNSNRRFDYSLADCIGWSGEEGPPVNTHAVWQLAAVQGHVAIVLALLGGSIPGWIPNLANSWSCCPGNKGDFQPCKQLAACMQAAECKRPHRKCVSRGCAPFVLCGGVSEPQPRALQCGP